MMLTLDNPLNPMISLRNALPRGLTDALNITSFYVGKTYGLARAEAKLKEIGFEIEGRGTLAHAPRYFAVRFLRWAESANLMRLQAILSRAFSRMEVMGRLPTAQLTGHFIWVNARKPE